MSSLPSPFALRRLMACLAFLLLFAPLSAGAYSLTLPASLEVGDRTQLLSTVLREEISRYHYSHKSFDDQLSQAAFDLYLKQLDGQKRFLLQKDVAELRRYANLIDDEMRNGRLDLSRLGGKLLQQRLEQVKEMVASLLASPLDFKRRETLETDPEKLDYCADAAALKERWRKIVTLQVINRYLNLQEEEEANLDVKKEGAPLEDLRAKAVEKIRKSYDDLFVRMLQETPQEYDDRFLNAVTRAFDPHSNYMPPTQKEDFDISMRGSLEGIGATLREEDGYIKVVEIIPGSAAARQGELEAEDVILKVAEGDAEPVDVTDSRLRDAVSLIRGKKGTEVRLTVKKHDASIRVIPIVRDVVQIEETFVKSTILDDPEGASFGYLRIPSFYRDFQASMDGGGRNCSDDVRAELKKLKEAMVSGVVIDLRNNGGGALTDAVNIAGFFIPSGPVVQIKDSRGRLRELDDEDSSILYDGPLVVLVNQFSASASEILAGALQDYGRAVVIGSEHTHGKGTVQALLDLDRSLTLPNADKYRPLGALKVTIQKFYRVSGGSTQYRGVIPDIVLPDRLAHLESGEKYLDYSLPWDTVAPSDYQRRDQVSTLLPRLQEKSRQRVSTDDQWQELRKEASLARQRSEQTLLSLHIDDVRKERDEVKALAGGERPDGHPEGEEKLDPDDKKAWKAQLAEDLYAQESLAILRDIIAARAVTASTATPYGRGH